MNTVIVAFSVFLGLIASNVPVGSSFPSENSKHKAIGIFTNSLGPIDGKIYSYNTTPRTWDEAKEFCEAGGRNLAKVEKVEHKEFLNSKYRNFTGYFWTAGRDSGTIAQFLWDDEETPTEVVEEAVNLEYIQEKQTCLLYLSSLAPQFEGISCSGKYGSLCEEPAA